MLQQQLDISKAIDCNSKHFNYKKNVKNIWCKNCDICNTLTNEIQNMNFHGGCPSQVIALVSNIDKFQLKTI